jgi:hypothetical protein
MVRIFLLTGLFAASVSYAGGLTYADAKALADRDEGSLSAEQMQTLVQAQAPVLQAALASCMALRGASSFSFVVVVQLDRSGKIGNTWRNDASKLAVCFQNKVAQANLNPPPRSPFYSSFEMDIHMNEGGH